ncbi:MAG TPA: histidine kinase [Enteractinococcus helveticum]|uniref:histidine kinase n=1 Tax=Enteractinococcus helveticum TaxID=1837282 RepID=A0A921K8F4_9MICC|nr:histidine kinase [Enteractinococcus helveticum]HJF13869.1 histidine kinase [Enteractinococcus helveticum]
MKFFDRIAYLWRTYPRIADGLITLPLLGLIVLSSSGAARSATFPILVYHWPEWALQAVIITVLVLHMAPWVFRRTNPVASAAVVVVGSLIQLFLGPELLPSMVMVLLTVQNLAHLAPWWASIAGFVTALIGAVLYAASITLMPHFIGHRAGGEADIYGPVSSPIFVLPISIPIIALVVLAWAIGNVQRTRRVRVETLQARTEQLQIEARQERELAAADERNRIARELHDIVAHSLQVMISQADGGRYAAKTQPEIAGQTLETIATTGRDALNQMRRLLGVLRDTDDAETSPQPTLADLDELIETVRLSGLQVDLHTIGQPAHQLADGAELVLYRIIQEALTNVARHAGPQASATVTLHWRATGVAVTIDDDGAGTTKTDNAGQGLVGMRERTALYDGTLHAGPKAGGGFRVHAHLPYPVM